MELDINKIIALYEQQLTEANRKVIILMVENQQLKDELSKTKEGKE